MAVLRNSPYGNFNFLVEIDGADGQSVQAGFCEVVLPVAEVAVTEFREGNDRDNAPIKLPGITRYSDCVLRRGVIGSLDLWEWFRTVRDGSVQRRNVSVSLLTEDRSQVVMAWSLRNCFPVKYVSPTLRGLGEIAIEELVLSVERVDIE